jgi:hypothetical protein
VRLFGTFSILFPEVNSHRNQESQAGDAEPSEDDASDGHAFAVDAERIAADLAECEIAEYHGGDGADAPHPENAGDEAADGKAAGHAWGEKNGRGFGVEGGIESGVQPALAMAAFDGRLLDLLRTIGTRFHERAPGRVGLLYGGTIRSRPAVVFVADHTGFIGIEMADP